MSLLTLLLLMSLDQNLIHVFDELFFDQDCFLEGLDVEKVLLAEVVFLSV